ncbi:saccharopine dehydrogenase NADP-binding domain-containing protein [Nocardia salmonicida]|uniref:saccharopine dehydrogenase NADP-binding domain-containing protein n=1 Tax=Nocardia salmonicida TaxID=53431 RepID=UPI0007A52749|nr:saccharopine dehydrogenase NADP-binding domain-containing protein [Nocardia salmonicida]
MKIAVYGASGHVGTFAVRELRERGIEAVVVGRNAARLAGFDVEVRVAEADDHTALVAAFADVDAVISTLPDYTGRGEGVLRAAIAAGVHYVDVAGEQLFVEKVFAEFGPLAAEAGVTLSTATTEAGIFGDLLAHLGAERLGGADEIVLSHVATPGGEGSRGSMRTVFQNLDVFTSGGLSWSDGEFQTGPQPRRTTFLLPDETEPIAVMKFPQPSVVTIPRHTTVRSEGVLAKSIFEIVGTVTEADLDAAPETPSAPAAYSMVVDIHRDGRALRGIGSGPDAYRNSAQLAVEVATRIATGAGKPGAQSPAELFEPVEFLDALAPFGMTWSLR